MKRRLFNILSTVSLLLCVATMVLGMLSIWVVTMWGYRGASGEPYFAVKSCDGCISVEYLSLPPEGWKRVTGFDAYPAPAGDFRWNQLGFDGQIVTEILFFIIPDWFICFVTAVLPFLWYRSYRRRRLRNLKGLCLQCGYDLRASKDRCPECGTPIPVQTATSGKA